MDGSTIAHYRVGSKLGEGGMGEVYQATDTKLSRQVALKMLPEAFTADAERLERFRREARALAALSHPNIGAIHGIEEADGRVALVLELIEGETLADRISAGPMSLEVALPIAEQIATALEAAHERGIVHRDLKPANIKITPEGQVKVLDFGLAKSIERDQGRGDAEVTRSPTLMMTAATPGVVMGTAAYMSPEQAKGLPVDRRADIWAYGAVLFEMLTGRRLFAGDDLTEVLAAVISTDPDLSRLPSSLPSWLRDLVERSLRRDATMRTPDIAVARIALREAGGSVEEATPVASGRRGSWATAAVALLAGLALGAYAVSLLRPPEPTAATTHTELILTPPPLPDSPVAISPDGTLLAYAGGDDEYAQMIYVRSLVDGTVEPVPGSEHGGVPAFSPDGRSLAFIAAGRLRVGALGGLPEVLAGVAGGAEGMQWMPDDTIVFATMGNRMLQRIPASGGMPTEVDVQDAADDLWVSDPSRLPDPEMLLVSIESGETSGSRMARLSLRDGTLDEIGPGSNARFVAPDVLVFLQRRVLVAARFDPDTLELGAPQALDLQGVSVITMPRSAGDQAIAGFSASGLALLPMEQPAARALVWVTPDGTETPTGFEYDAGDRVTMSASGSVGASLSPDGERVAVIADEAALVVDLDDVEQRRTLPRAGSSIAYARWHPDGEHVILIGNRGGAFQGYSIAANGTGLPQQITRLPQSIVNSVLPDGSYLGYVVTTEGRDLWLFGADGTDAPLLQTPANERAPMSSPDGKAYVYVSDADGEDRVYLRLFPDVGQEWRISEGRATAAMWSRDGSQIFYLQGSRMMSIDVDLSDGVRTGSPHELFAVGSYEEDPFGIPMYDVAVDGRFLMVQRGSGARTWRWIRNWGVQLDRLVDGS